MSTRDQLTRMRDEASKTLQRYYDALTSHSIEDIVSCFHHRIQFVNEDDTELFPEVQKTHLWIRKLYVKLYERYPRYRASRWIIESIYINASLKWAQLYVTANVMDESRRVAIEEKVIFWFDLLLPRQLQEEYVETRQGLKKKCAATTTPPSTNSGVFQRVVGNCFSGSSGTDVYVGDDDDIYKDEGDDDDLITLDEVTEYLSVIPNIRRMDFVNEFPEMVKKGTDLIHRPELVQYQPHPQ